MARQRSRRWGPRWRGTVSKSSSGWGCGPRHETPPVVALEGVRVKAQRFSVVLVKSNGSVRRPVSRSTIEGGEGMSQFVAVLGGDGTEIAPPGYLSDQSPRKMS